VLPLGVHDAFEFCRDLLRQKTRGSVLWCNVVCVILRLAVSVEHRLVTDRQTDKQAHDHGIYHASMASRDKNDSLIDVNPFIVATTVLITSFNFANTAKGKFASFNVIARSACKHWVYLSACLPKVCKC